MSIVPDAVMAFLGLYLAPLLDWFSQRVYCDLLRRDPDHLLQQVQAQLDLKPLEHLCADYYHAAGPGARPTHTVPQLVRALLVGYLYDWSLRQLEWQIRFNLMVKWFVGYSLGAAGPDHTTLERFELWVCERHHRVFFDSVLGQIDADFPEARAQAQIGDTFALRGNAARERLIRLIRHSCQCLLRALQHARPELAVTLALQYKDEALFGSPQEVAEYWLDEAGCAARLQTTVLAARACATWVRSQLDTPASLPPDRRRPIEAWLNRLDKIWADEVTLRRDAAGQVAQVAIATVKGHYRFGSATDPEVTYRVHGTGEHKSELGYNVRICSPLFE